MRIIATNAKIRITKTRVSEKVIVPKSDTDQVIEVEYDPKHQPVIRLFCGV